MKIGQKYKIEKPKTEDLVLSAEGLTDILFGSKTEDKKEETKEVENEDTKE